MRVPPPRRARPPPRLRATRRPGARLRARGRIPACHALPAPGRSGRTRRGGPRRGFRGRGRERRAARRAPRRRPPRRAGSTSRRCRGGFQPRARSSPARPAPWSARARRRRSPPVGSAAPLHCIGASRSSRTSSGGSLTCCSARASSMSSEMSVVISPSCSTTSDRSRRRSHGGSVRSPARTSMFVRTLVSGVRSSWDASATSWRCARVDSSSAPSIVLKLAASRLSSSVPSTSMRSERSWVSETRSTVVVRRVTGVSAARATTSPSPAAITIPPSATSTRKMPIRLSDCSTSGAAARPVSLRRTVREREHAEVRPVDGDVLPVGSVVSAGDRKNVLVDRDPTFWRGGRARLRSSARAARSRAPPRTPVGARGTASRRELEDLERLDRDLGRPIAERGIHGREQLIAGDDVHEDRCGDDGQRDRRRRPDRDARPEAHLNPRAARSRRRGPCGSDAAPRAPPSCGGGTRCRRPASSRSGRSRNPTRARR